MDPSNRDLGDAAHCLEDAELVRDLQLQLHRVMLELAGEPHICTARYKSMFLQLLCDLHRGHARARR